MSEITCVVFSRTYKMSNAEIELRKAVNETFSDTAKRLAIAEMQEEMRSNFLEPGDDDFTIRVI